MARLEVRIETPTANGQKWPCDRLWIVGLEHEVGFCERKPGAAFLGVFYHLDQSELDAIRYALDVRDATLFPETKCKAWPQRPIKNPYPPRVYAAAKEKIARRNRQERDEDPAIWVPADYEN